MAFSSTSANYLARHVYLNEAIPNIGDATGLPAAATAGNLYLRLHTGDPGLDGSANEADYEGYEPLELPRSSSGFSVSANVVTALVGENFAVNNSGSTISFTHVTIWTAATGGWCVDRGVIQGGYQCPNGNDVSFVENRPQMTFVTSLA